MTTTLIRTSLSSLLALLLTASCGTGGSSAGSSSGTADVPASASQSSTAGPANMSFRSHTYGYSLTVPATWLTEQARRSWNGRTSVSSDSPQVDQFSLPTSAQLSSWGVAAPWKETLAAYTDFIISWTHRYHGDTCPPRPETRTRISIGGEPGVLLSYNCGILINVAATVHRGTGYQFGFRDPTVHAATNPDDHATFLHILKSIRFHT